MKRILIVLIFIIMTLHGCSNNSNNVNESRITTLEQELESITQNGSDISELTTTIEQLNVEIKSLQDELNSLKDDQATLSSSIKEKDDYILELEKKIAILNDLIELDHDFVSFLELNDHESDILNNFRETNDVDLLTNIEPLTTFKLFVVSGYIKDYSTQYEFFTTQDEFNHISKDDFITNSKDDNIDYSIFNDTYNTSITVDENDQYATITWKSKNGQYDRESGPYIYGFNLIKENDIWRVSFLPYQ